MLGQYKNSALFGTRLIQVVCLSLMVIGFVWSSSDFLLLTILADSPVTPLSVMFMLYGLLGSVLSELMARWINKSSNSGEKKDGGALA